MITCEIISDIEEIKAFYPEIDRMYDAGEYEASLSVEWTEALRKTHVEGAKFFLMVLRDSTEILGLVPLCIREVKRQGLSLSTLFPLPEYFNTHSDLLFKNGSKELVEVFLKAMFRLKEKWDIFRINRFVENSPVFDLITMNLKNGSPFKYEVRRAEPSFFIELGNSYTDYLGTKNSHFRNNLKRAFRKMNSLGDVGLLKTSDFKSFSEAYDLILSIEEKSWKHEHGTAITSTRKQREFYRILCGGAFDRGRLRFNILTVNHDPVAFEMGLLRGDKYYSVHGSYDEKFRKENPGAMLLSMFIEHLIKEGVREFDFFGEPFEWEKGWTDKFRWHKSLLIYNNSPKARLFWGYNKLRNKMRGPEEDRIMLRNPRDIRPNAG